MPVKLPIRAEVLSKQYLALADDGEAVADWRRASIVVSCQNSMRNSQYNPCSAQSTGVPHNSTVPQKEIFKALAGPACNFCSQMAMGQKPVPPVNIPNPGAPTPKWYHWF